MTAVWIILTILVLLFAFVVLFGAPFVPTRRKWAAAALDLAKVGPGDVVVDLGSGDGVVLRLAAARGARAIGYELNPILYFVSKIRCFIAGITPAIYLKNFWAVDLPPDTTVVYVFAVERDEAKLIKYLENQARKVSAHQLKVISFGLPLSGKKSLGRAGAANLYTF